ncbi:hypothetical protein L1987_13500 [Smallanthus sonchifolius]|uniref:Uncharacterized protein n=1 Tax=Smallanthus sonchifolius TaxID=185202 RepID=A0ACB9JIV0_9ASTR|nr:hypothetical protein L1987_13500 [Smallanthus sonchifolius]
MPESSGVLAPRPSRVCTSDWDWLIRAIRMWKRTEAAEQRATEAELRATLAEARVEAMITAVAAPPSVPSYF